MFDTNEQADIFLKEVERIKSIYSIKESDAKSAKYGVLLIEGNFQAVYPPIPDRPDPKECCKQNCSPCIFDNYKQELETAQKIKKIIDEEYYRRCDPSIRDIEDFVVFLPKPEKMGSLLIPSTFRPMVIQSKQFSSNKRTLRLIFGIGTGILKIGYNQYLSMKLNHGTDVIVRSYTPVSHPYDQDHLEFLIRIYPHGKMSRALSDLEEGQTVLFRGPLDHQYRFVMNSQTKGHILLLAGGSGITPLYQLLMYIESRQPIYPSKVTLFYCCAYYQDLWKVHELKTMSERSKGLIQIYFWISRESHKNMSIACSDSIFANRRMACNDLKEKVFNTPRMCRDTEGILCGPNSFTSEFSRGLSVELNIDSEYIHVC